MGRLALAVPPTIEPVTIDDAKLFAKIDPDMSVDNDLVGELIAAARKAIEEKLDRSIITQDWDYFLDAFPDADCPIRLERPPVVTVSSVKYTPNGGSLVTVNAADYYLDNTLDSRGRPRRGEVWLQVGKAWPGDVLRVANGVQVRYTAGYAAKDVPQSYRLGIKQLVAYWYYNRSVIGTIPDDIAAVMAGAPSAFIYA